MGSLAPRQVQKASAPVVGPVFIAFHDDRVPTGVDRCSQHVKCLLEEEEGRGFTCDRKTHEAIGGSSAITRTKRDGI